MSRQHVLPLVALALATAAVAQESAPGQPAPPVEVRSARPGVGRARRSGTLVARVNAVDVSRRLISLEDAQGRIQTITVSDAVKRLDQVAPGDTVTARFEQTLTLEYEPEGAPTVERSVTGDTTRAGPGSPPAGTRSTEVRATVTVVDVDPLYRVVTLQERTGEKYRVTAGVDIDLIKVQAGQRYLATYTDTLAVEVEKTSAAPFGPAPGR